MEFNSEKFNVKINGVVHELNYPTVKQIRDLEKSKDDLGIDNVCKLVNDCGLPLEIVEGLQANHLNELVSALVGKNQAS